MKSALRQVRMADLISSEAIGGRFHPSLLGFHRALRDFIDFSFHLWYNKHKEVMIMAENKLADMSTEFAVKI